MAIKHTKTSAIPDGPDAAQVQPSDWNADHSLLVSASRLLGNATVASAEVAEVSLGNGLVFGAGSLELQLKTVNSESLLGTGNIVIEGGGAGLTLFEESRNTASPNATVPVHVITAIGAETNIDFVIAPKGTGAIVARVPDGTNLGGNKRGAYAVDLQLAPASFSNYADRVASGMWSFTAGRNCKAADFYSIAMGNNCQSTGDTGVAVGDNCTAGPYGVSLGSNCLADGLYSSAFGRSTTTRNIRNASASGAAAFAGRQQMVNYPLRWDTTSVVPQMLSTDGTLSSESQSLVRLPVMPNNSAYYCRLRVLARNTATNESMSWSGTALIKRGANAASTTLIGSTIASDFGDAAMSACTVTLSADTTRGALAVIVTGLASTTVRWVAQLETVEAA